jgi:antitoxin component of MazEF toxin-antitoxin module
MEAVVQRWGRDFGVRIPSAMAREMSLKTGYKVFIAPMMQERKYSLESLLSGINKNNIHKEISFGKEKIREQW